MATPKSKGKSQAKGNPNWQTRQMGPLAEYDAHSQPSPHTIMLVRKSGFWASFLAWIFLFVFGSFFLIFLTAASRTRKSVSAFEKNVPAENVPAENVPAENVSAENVPTQSREPFETELLAQATGGLFVGLTFLALVAGVGMLIMLLRFGSGTKTMERYPSWSTVYTALERQRKLWIWIGIFCLCGIIQYIATMAITGSLLFKLKAAVEEAASAVPQFKE